MKAIEIASLNKKSRIAGVLFFIWILTGLFGLMYVPSQIKLSGDAASVTQSILANELLFRIQILVGPISGALWVLLVLHFFQLFKLVSDFQSKLLVAFVLVQIPITLISGAFSLTTLMIAKGELLHSMVLEQRQDWALVFIKINNYTTLVLEMFWGLWLLPLAALVYRSGFLPRFLGVWLVINGVAYVILSVTNLLWPQYGGLIYKIGFPAFFGELMLMLWLSIIGARMRNGTQPILQEA